MRNSEHGVNLLGTSHSAFRNPQFALMGLASDLRILYHLALKPVRGKDHAARMESFYAGQAAGYDDFRKRLLKGRQELWNLIQPPPGGTWLDMGGGTGANLEYFRGQGTG